MSLVESRLQATLQAAAARIKRTVEAAAERARDALGSTALAATSGAQREALLAAHFDLERSLPRFHLRFAETLDEKIAAQLAPRGSGGARATAWTDWQSLSLVEDDAVEELVSADRLAQAIAHDCEWELRELSTYVGALMKSGHAERDGNPLKPELIGKALARALDEVTPERERRQLIGRELVRLLAPAMKTCYAEIVADLQQRGIEPVGLTVKTVAGPGHRSTGYGSSFASESVPASLREAHHEDGAGHDTLGLPLASQPGALGSDARHDARSTGGGHADTGWREASTGRGVDSQRSRGADSSRGPASTGGRGPGSRGTPIGQVDAEMMSLMRRLAVLGGQAREAEGGIDTDMVARLADAQGRMAPQSGLMAPNVIRAHRDELRRASTGTLDHMVIDVVGSLFDQILSDPKVPPQMARQIARLQLPVLRVALGDPSFFSSRRHPVRRFVNRIASLACAFDDFAEDPGLALLTQVRELVQQIVEGDFDQMEVYEGRLAELEAFTAQSNAEAVQSRGEAASFLHGKETELRLQQRYMQLLAAALTPLAIPEFLREFLSQVWSQAIVGAVAREGPQSETARQLRLVGRELVMSVQPKGTPAHRKNFLLKLPRLMKDLNEGLDRIGWPEAAKKQFFAQLLPAHSESLKGTPLTELQYNLLASELDSVLARPLPQAADLAREREPLPELQDVVLDHRFSPEEAERIGLVPESAVDWDGKVDIVVGLDPVDTADPGNATDIDISIEGLPTADPPEPMQGSALAEQVQIGFAYQMLLKEQWQKVRLSYVSPGRAFFVFTHGKKHQETISMTARMLARMCESERLRPFENAYLIERATARARKQLAAITSAAQPAAMRH